MKFMIYKKQKPTLDLIVGP